LQKYWYFVVFRLLKILILSFRLTEIQTEMANLKRRPESDLNHENWDQEEPPEDQGEFRRAAEEDLRQRRILKPRKRIVRTQ